VSSRSQDPGGKKVFGCVKSGYVGFNCLKLRSGLSDTLLAKCLMNSETGFILWFLSNIFMAANFVIVFNIYFEIVFFCVYKCGSQFSRLMTLRQDGPRQCFIRS
jgi:hypothetical protein